MLGSLARRRCSMPNVVNFIKSYRVHGGELDRKLNQEINTLRWLCILLHVFIHLILWCHDTLHFHLPAIPTKSFPSISREGSHKLKGTNFRTRWSIRLNIHMISSLHFLMQVIAFSLIPQWLQTAVQVIPLHISTYVTLPRHNWNMRPKLNAGNWGNHIEVHYRRGNIQHTAYYSARLYKHDRESAMNLTAMRESCHNNLLTYSMEQSPSWEANQ
jgi:hypothetical protein